VLASRGGVGNEMLAEEEQLAEIAMLSKKVEKQQLKLE